MAIKTAANKVAVWAGLVERKLAMLSISSTRTGENLSSHFSGRQIQANSAASQTVKSSTQQTTGPGALQQMAHLISHPVWQHRYGSNFILAFSSPLTKYGDGALSSERLLKKYAMTGSVT